MKHEIRIFTILIIVMVCVLGSLSGKSELLENFNKIAGDYEMYYPLGTKGIYYLCYYIDKGKMFVKQEGDPEILELIQEGSNPLFFKTPKDGNIHKFFENDSGKFDKIILKTKEGDIMGIKLPARVYKEDGRPKIGEKYSVKAMIDDFDQMVRIIKYLHPSIYDYTTKDEFDRFIKNSRAKISRPMRINEFFGIAAPVMSKMGCAHSFLSPSEFYRSFQAKYFPLVVHLIKGKLYVIDSYNDSYSYLKGVQLTAINGISISRIIQQILNSLTSDWNNPQFKKYLLNHSFRLHYYYHYGSQEKFHINFKTPNSKKNGVLEITGIIKEEITKANKRILKHPIYPQEPYSLTFLKNDQIAVIRIKNFYFYQKNLADKFFEFINQSFIKIKQKKIKNLLIDIRGNMGGSPFCSSHLLTYLIDKPFQYFIKDRPGEHGYSKFFKLQYPQANIFKGKVITLVDNGCLSTSGHLIGMLKYHNIGKLAGIKTGCTFSCTNGSSVFFLRNTGTRLRTAKERFTASVKGMPIDEGIIPDYRIDLTLKDLLDARDLQLEKAIGLFEQK